MCLRYKKRSPSISRPEALLLKKEKYKNKKNIFEWPKKMEGTSHKKRGESICAQGFSPGFFFFILHIVFLFSSSFLETHLFYFNANNFLRKYCANIEPKTNFSWPFFTWWKNLLFSTPIEIGFSQMFFQHLLYIRKRV
jgi:hypothetical protein